MQQLNLGAIPYKLNATFKLHKDSVSAIVAQTSRSRIGEFNVLQRAILREREPLQTSSEMPFTEPSYQEVCTCCPSVVLHVSLFWTTSIQESYSYFSFLYPKASDPTSSCTSIKRKPYSGLKIWIDAPKMVVQRWSYITTYRIAQRKPWSKKKGERIDIQEDMLSYHVVDSKTGINYDDKHALLDDGIFQPQCC